MKFSKLLMTTSLCAAVSSPGLAQGTPFSEVDSDDDGALSLSELVSVFGESSAERIMIRADRNGDGELSRLEIRVRNDDESDDEEGDDEEDDDEQASESDDEEGDENDESDESDEEDDDEEDDDGEDDESDESNESDEGDESDDEEDA
ncbi:MAG: hypothetical protein ACR2OY_07180 [Boseongicola sp.]